MLQVVLKKLRQQLAEQERKLRRRSWEFARGVHDKPGGSQVAAAAVFFWFSVGLWFARLWNR